MITSFFENILNYCKKAITGLKQIKDFRPSMMRKVFSLMGTREKSAFLLLALALAASAFISVNNLYTAMTVPAPAVGGEYREGILGQPRLINPILATSSADSAIIHLVFSGLYKYDNSGNLLPDLADGKPEISADQKQFTIRLKRDVKWHNDKPFTADDVIFTIKTIQDPAFKSPLRATWIHTTPEKKDDYTLVLTNKDISGPFLDNLTLPIISKSVWGKVDASSFPLSLSNLEAVGTGPYSIKEIKKLPTGKVQNIKLESFSNYYFGKPYIQNLVLNFYDNNDDIINALHSKVIEGVGFIPLDESLYLDKGNESLNIMELPMPQYQAVFLNTKNPILADQKVRKALSLATDSAKILQEVFKGQGRLINSPILPEQLSQSEKPSAQPFDLKASQGLLDAAGWRIDPATNLRTKNKNVLELTLATNDSPLNTKTAEMIVEQWKALNVKVNLNILPNRDLSETLIRPRSFQALLFSQNLGPDPDPFAFWHSSQSKDPGLNITGFSNTEADKIITEARTTVKNNERSAQYKRFSEIIAAEAPAIFLNQTVFVYAVDSKVQNITLKSLYDPAYRFYDITNWYIEKTRDWK